MNAKMKHAIALALVPVTTMSIQAHAALPASVATTFTEIESNINSIFGLAFPVVALGLGLTVVIKLFKRFGNKV